MKTLITIFSLLILSNLAFSQNSCDNAFQYCGNDVGLALDTTGADLGPIDCLGNSPNPTWFFFEVDQAGDVNIQITGNDGMGGSGIDIDVVVMGPYVSLDCPNITDSIADNPIVYCNYSTSGVNPFSIAGAQSGEIYVIIVTNYSDQAGFADFVNQSSTATLVQSSCFGGFEEFAENDFDFTVLNPFNDFLQLSDFPRDCTLSVYDMTGRKVYYKEDISNHHSVNLNHIEAGILIVELTNDEGEKSIKKVIKY